MAEIRGMMLEALRNHTQAHIDKHKVNVEVYLTNPVGIGDHSSIMDAVEKEIDEMAIYQDRLEILDKYF
jgi:hypothetical protein